MTWPLDSMAYANSTTAKNVIGENYMAAGLNHGARVLLAGEIKFRLRVARYRRIVFF